MKQLLVSFQEKITQASTFWFIRVLWVIEIMSIFGFLIADMSVRHLSIRYALVVPYCVGIIVVAYVLTMLAGEWNESKQRQQMDAINTCVLIAFAIAGFVACYLVVFEYRQGIMPYYGVFAIGLPMLGANIVNFLFRHNYIRPPLRARYHRISDNRYHRFAHHLFIKDIRLRKNDNPVTPQ